MTRAVRDVPRQPVTPAPGGLPAVGPEPLLGAGQPRPGARPLGGGEWSFVVWAPEVPEMALHLLAGPDADERTVALRPDGRGYHGVRVGEVGPGQAYRFVLDGPDGPLELADPASRWQPQGVHGPSATLDPGGFTWSHDAFRCPPLEELVIYQVHVGTFTAAGTFDAAAEMLGDLADLGVNAVEPLPVAQFPGRRNWGYDGVFPYAVQDSYGGPFGFARFVDACHGQGLAVLVDAVYNHLGPEGSVLTRYGPYLTDRYRTPWGPAVNFDGPGSDEVRRFFAGNALSWFEDYHVDGLRLDAVHEIVDRTARPFLRELADATAEAAPRLGRRLVLVAESPGNDPAVVAPSTRGGLGLDAQWSDDFHHALHARLTGERQGYYEDFGEISQVARAWQDGFVFQGQYSRSRNRRHGMAPSGVGPQQLVVFAQNHDQIGNRPRGERLTALVGAGPARLAAAITVLSPFVPLLFMGEEYGERAPFPYFVDSDDPALVEAVRRGRAWEMGARWDAEPLDPAEPGTFRAAVLDRSVLSRPEHAARLALYRRLLELRRLHRALGCHPHGSVEASVEGDLVLAVRRAEPDAVAALAFNLGEAEVVWRLPAEAVRWLRVLDSADPKLGGAGRGLPPGAVPGEDLLLGPWGFGVYLGDEPLGDDERQGS